MASEWDRLGFTECDGDEDSFDEQIQKGSMYLKENPMVSTSKKKKNKELQRQTDDYVLSVLTFYEFIH